MRTRPVPWHLVVVEADEYWQAGGHGNPAKDFLELETYLGNKTKSDSSPWGDYDAWREGN